MDASLKKNKKKNRQQQEQKKTTRKLLPLALFKAKINPNE